MNDPCLSSAMSKVPVSGWLKIMSPNARTMRRILMVVTAVNLTGMACMWQSTQVMSGPRGQDDIIPNLVESVGFALMLPGIFFASAILLLSRAFGWNEGTTCAVWYFSAGMINLMLARSAGSGSTEW